MSGWRRPLPLAAAAALIVLAVPTAIAASDQTGSGLVGYEIESAAPSVELVYDNPAFPTPTHPVFTGTLPEATSTMNTGPETEGFTSILWPGPLAGNLGTTIQQLNQLCAPASIPLPPGANCLPVPPALKQALVGKNDPVRADAKNSGPQDATYGGPGALYMRAHAVDQEATADAGVSSFVAAPLVSFGSVTGHSSAQLANSGALAVGDALETIGGMDVGAGLPGLPANVALLHIDSLVSTVHVQSDGTKGSGKGGTVISGVTVAGMPATIDQDGLHVGPVNQPLGSLLAPIADTASRLLGQFKFKVFVTQPVEQTQGSSESLTLGGVKILFTTPDGSSFQITMGKAAAAVDGSPNEPFPALPAIPPVAEPSVSAPEAALAAPSLPDLASSPSATPSAPVAAAVPQSTRNTSFLPGFGGLAVGLLIAGLVAVALIGAGLKRLSDDVLAEAPGGPACPNEGKHP
jgi:hypothetical protein